MFALKMFSSRQVETLPESPREWGEDGLQRYLASLNSRKEVDRLNVRRLQLALESAILSECRAPYTSVQMVLQSELRFLPIQLRVYRELHEYTQIWLW